MGAPKYRLRSMDAEIGLGLGRTLLGRAADCELVLDDPLVSRRHAAFERTESGVTIEDLGSRNGTLVNGVRITTPVRLDAGDRITIGTRQFTLLELDSPRERKQTLVGDQAAENAPSGAYRRPPPTLRPPPPAPLEREETHTACVYDLLVASCEECLSRGDVAGAESAASNLFVSVRAGILRGRTPDGATMTTVTDFALDLAVQTGRVRWLDRLFELYGVAGRVLEAEAVDRVHRLVQQEGFIVDQALERYLDRLRAIASRGDRAPLSEPERLCLMRLEEVGGTHQRR